MSLRRAPSEKAQAARTTKAGFTNSDGWMPSRRCMIQRCAPLISGPNWKASEDQRHADEIDQQGQPPHVAQATGTRPRIKIASAGRRKSTCRLTKWKVERPEPLGDGRTAGHEEDEARDHERGERREQQAVDRPPPIAESRAFRA